MLAAFKPDAACVQSSQTETAQLSKGAGGHRTGAALLSAATSTVTLGLLRAGCLPCAGAGKVEQSVPAGGCAVSFLLGKRSGALFFAGRARRW